MNEQPLSTEILEFANHKHGMRDGTGSHLDTVSYQIDGERWVYYADGTWSGWLNLSSLQAFVDGLDGEPVPADEDNAGTWADCLSDVDGIDADSDKAQALSLLRGATEAIEGCEDLDALADLLNAGEALLAREDWADEWARVMHDLPVSGPEVADTMPSGTAVWAWDATRMLVTAEGDKFTVVDRTDLQLLALEVDSPNFGDVVAVGREDIQAAWEGRGYGIGLRFFRGTGLEVGERVRIATLTEVSSDIIWS